jgi:hypothetical protein
MYCLKQLCLYELFKIEIHNICVCRYALFKTTLSIILGKKYLRICTFGPKLAQSFKHNQT